MGLFRYIVQGFGWEVGSQAAREAIDAAKKQAAELPEEKPLTEKDQKQLLAQVAKREAAEKAARDAAAKKKQADIDAQLAELKKKAGR